MGWTNAALQQMINKNKERICYISLNNGKGLFIGYPGKYDIQMDDISLEVIGGIDTVKVHHKKNTMGKEIEWDSYFTTEFIEAIDVMTEEFGDYRIDPYVLKA